MFNQAAQLPILDHFVILVSHNDLLGISQQLDGQFTLAPGGNHADGLTTNKLVLLPDGCYLEFIAFFEDVDPKARRSHRWGNEKEGTIIDWAFTLPSENDFDVVQNRFRTADIGASYTDPIPGGRTKPDGTVLKWAVCTPKNGDVDAVTPGTMPFWCLDRTPRERRVPYEMEPNLTQHPNGVQGVSSVSVQVPHGEISNLKDVYDVIFGGPWKYNAHSGSTSGHNIVSLSGGEKAINLVFYGSKPGKVDLLPGLVLEIESLSS
ncbi:uncharacterized protein N7496_007405 [Penicillium cataractarum]|uniref:Glyoxalase-like domain-containing protein n=1 Tax=Penicillium cataractarum TaxID=2100454 RepID=A0A9W9S3D6_9EURO|nr:uncharacterized protein N7496_007405 [Penicillium cataractarum]KAJ5371313.1 hypothetical protein N7496_007405 [Penicillium cataractarum]